VPNATDVITIKNIKRNLDGMVQNRINADGEPKYTLIKLAEIEDYRSKFF